MGSRRIFLPYWTSTLCPESTCRSHHCSIVIVFIPISKQFIEKLIKRNLSLKIRIVIFFVLTVIAGFLVTQDQQKEAEELANQQKQELISYFTENKNQIISDIENKLTEKSFSDALVETKKYLITEDKKIQELHSTIQKAQTNAQRQKRIEYILNELKTIPAKEYQKNRELYQQLLNLDSNNKSYKEKFNFYDSKYKAEQEKRQKQEQRKQDIEKQFSAWDGSHRNLEKVIKDSMRDPDSYKHEETRYLDKGDHLVVITKYRGKNAFGAYVRGSVTAKVSIYGTVLEIIDQ